MASPLQRDGKFSRLGSRGSSGTQLSATAIAAMITGIGMVLLCLLCALIYLLVRAVRTHKQLLKDLEERGVSMAEARKEARKETLAKPRAVLRRNTVLPFNSSTGWGTLPSVETIGSVESTTAPAHYVPSMPAGPNKRKNVLIWPFSSRRRAGHAVQMKKLQTCRLSTVIESPLRSPQMSSCSSTAPISEYGNPASSDQSLLRFHPAFRGARTATNPRSRAGTVTRDARLHRARSIAEVPSLQAERPQLRVRSTSLCSQIPGKVPDVILPPLPLDISRIKDEAKRRSELRHMPSKQSISSVASVDSAILTARSSPALSHKSKARGQRLTKPNAKGSSFAGGRTFRDNLDLRTRPRGPRDSLHLKSALAKSSPAEVKELPVRHVPRPQATSQSRGIVKSAHSSLNNTPVASPRSSRHSSTPRRKSRTLVSSAGSPERKMDGSAYAHSMSRPLRSPKRQHSQNSSRSSGGNPFQWDPTPLIPLSGKPSVLKGSLSARQGHRRKNSVRISLVPTVHSLKSRTSSLPNFHDGPKVVARGTSLDGGSGLGLDATAARPLPAPPTSSTFKPELKLSTTSITAVLTQDSPSLTLIEYDQMDTPFPAEAFSGKVPREQKRSSSGSMLSLSNFPTTPTMTEFDISSQGNPTMLSFDFNGTWMPDTPLLQQFPFGTHVQPRTDFENLDLIQLDEYDPQQPTCIYQIPPAGSTSMPFRLACTTIPEESSVSSNRTRIAGRSRHDDSPSVSPKTLSPPRLAPKNDAVYDLPVHATIIPEETLETIDPALLSKGNFTVLNSSIDGSNNNFAKTPSDSYPSLTMPPPSSSFSESLPMSSCDSPTIGHIRSRQSSSEYSSRSPSPSPSASPVDLPGPVFPCSPRPQHADLPSQNPSINFANVPKLKPSPRGPRGSPPRPLRSSIAQLRRMNSDIAITKNKRSGRGERRYLRLGREDSLQVPGDESWLDELEDQDTELDEDEGRRLVGDILEDYEEGDTMLDLDDCVALAPISPPMQPKPNIDHTSTVGADTTAGAPAPNRTSSIWEDGEKFWTTTTTTTTTGPTTNTLNSSPPTTTKSPHSYKPLKSSPLASPCLPYTPRSSSPRKRYFEVARDDLPGQEEYHDHNFSSSSPRSKRGDVGGRNGNMNGNVDSAGAGRNRKRRVLGTATPNVRIQITSPGGSVGTPGSLYDAEGFLML